MLKTKRLLSLALGAIIALSLFPAFNAGVAAEPEAVT